MTSTQERCTYWPDTGTSSGLLLGWMIRGSYIKFMNNLRSDIIYRFVTASDDATAIVWNMEVCCIFSNVMCALM